LKKRFFVARYLNRRIISFFSEYLMGLFNEILAIVHSKQSSPAALPLPRPVSARLRRVWLGGDFDRVDAEYDADDANCQVVTSSDWSTIAISGLFNTLRPA
jgi:hypothetical protein